MKAYFHKHQQELLIHLETLSDGSTLFDKANILNLSPYDETVFLDADSIVLGKPDFRFTNAAQFGTAIFICEWTQAHRY